MRIFEPFSAWEVASEVQQIVAEFSEMAQMGSDVVFYYGERKVKDADRKTRDRERKRKPGET